MTRFLAGVAVGLALVPFVRACLAVHHYRQTVRLDVDSSERRSMLLVASGRES